jgi:hypothetical protein
LPRLDRIAFVGKDFSDAPLVFGSDIDLLGFEPAITGGKSGWQSWFREHHPRDYAPTYHDEGNRDENQLFRHNESIQSNVTIEYERICGPLLIFEAIPAIEHLKRIKLRYAYLESTPLGETMSGIRDCSAHHCNTYPF